MNNIIWFCIAEIAQWIVCPASCKKYYFSWQASVNQFELELS